MGRFDPIDGRLEEFAKRVNAIITKEHPGIQSPFNRYEERRIDWTDGDIRKTIMIQPTFDISGANTKLWSLTAIAWHKEESTGKFLAWRNNLVYREAFGIIESNIESLLSDSEAMLGKITFNELE